MESRDRKQTASGTRSREEDEESTEANEEGGEEAVNLWRVTR
jgi:hypothetical protein